MKIIGFFVKWLEGTRAHKDKKKNIYNESSNHTTKLIILFFTKITFFMFNLFIS